MHLSILYSSLLIFSIHLAEGVSLAKLSFLQEDGAQYIISNLEEDALAPNNPSLVTFLETATVACATGIWRFYPKRGFAYDPGTFPGYQIGYNEHDRCFDLSSANGNLSQMASYRALGPISSATQLNLDQDSITIYSGNYASGLRLSYNFPENTFPSQDFETDTILKLSNR